MLRFSKSVAVFAKTAENRDNVPIQYSGSLFLLWSLGFRIRRTKADLGALSFLYGVGRSPHISRSRVTDVC